jgi:hypothetical protein
MSLTPHEDHNRGIVRRVYEASFAGDQAGEDDARGRTTVGWCAEPSGPRRAYAGRAERSEGPDASPHERRDEAATRRATLRHVSRVLGFERVEDKKRRLR